MPSDLQCLALIQEKTDFNILFYKTIDSTNLEAKKLSGESYPEWTVVVADHQLSGRGRHGRTWHSPEGKNIYMSLILRPHGFRFPSNLLSLVAGISILESIRDFLKKDNKQYSLTCKWPNDILFNFKKVSGILSEAVFRGSNIEYIIVGIGVNVNMSFDDMPEELRTTATSIYIETGRAYERGILIKKILEKYKIFYRMLYTDREGLLRIWSENSDTLSRKVRAYTVDGVLEGIAESVDERGFLILETETGRKVISSGDIIHLR